MRSTNLRRIAVIGAGAMGSLFAARIAEHGRDVVLVDVDRARLATLGERGIRLVDDSGDRTIAIETSIAADLGDDVDLAIVLTKSRHTAAAVASIAHLDAGGTSVLTLQNGLGNPEAIAEHFAARRVVKGMAALPADLANENEVRTGGVAHLEVGPLVDEGQGLASAVADLLAESGFDARLSDAVDVAIWEKIAFNAALNPLAAVTRLANGGLDAAPGRRIAEAIVDEVVATAHASGVDVDRPRILAAVDVALTQHRQHEASMLQDLRAGRATEIDALNVAIADRAAATGVATPVTQTLADLTRLVEGAGA